jgi:OTU domain-containing protein 6
MADENIESLLARHKREQKALVAQITSLKKTVTKGEKSKRKEVLAEVDRLEKELKDRHQRELEQVKSPDVPSKTEDSLPESSSGDILEEGNVTQDFERLDLGETPSPGRSKDGKRRGNRQKARMVNHTISTLADADSGEKGGRNRRAEAASSAGGGNHA